MSMTEQKMGRLVFNSKTEEHHYTNNSAVWDKHAETERKCLGNNEIKGLTPSIVGEVWVCITSHLQNEVMSLQIMLTQTELALRSLPFFVRKQGFQITSSSSSI